jgi:hypothetical protein
MLSEEYYIGMPDKPGKATEPSCLIIDRDGFAVFRVFSVHSSGHIEMPEKYIKAARLLIEAFRV